MNQTSKHKQQKNRMQWLQQVSGKSKTPNANANAEGWSDVVRFNKVTGSRHLKLNTVMKEHFTTNTA